jgi:glycoside/pentoside/hexuronide:cation symporter, GPH family
MIIEPTRKELLAYSSPALPLAFLALPFIVMAPEFYAKDMGLPLAWVGYAFLVIRIVDALADPVTGWLCDRFRPGFGRRRLWMALTALPASISVYAAFVPPDNIGITYLLIAGCALSFSWTAMQVPYLAWGAELSRSYEGRTRVVAWRETLTVTGTLLALIIPALAPSFGFEDRRAALFLCAVLVVIILPLTALWSVSIVPEPVERSTTRLDLKQSLSLMAQNKPFRTLLATFFINGLANGLPAGLFLLYVAEKLAAPSSAGPLLLLYFISAVIGVPFWLKLAKRTSKHSAWRAGMMMACGGFIFAAILQPGDVMWFALICFITGFALGADVIMPLSIQADVIDLDTEASGEERSGLYLAIWAFASKLALGLSIGIAFPLLSHFGFDPGAGIRTEKGLVMLGFLYAGLPVLLKFYAVYQLRDFTTLTPSAHLL